MKSNGSSTMCVVPSRYAVCRERSLRDFAGQALLVVKIDGDVSAVLAD